MRVDEFSFELPQELIAQEPLADRADSRMLVVDRLERRWEDRRFRDLPTFLRRGDCLILNDTKVFPCRAFAQRDAGTARIEVFLLRPVTGLRWEALVRPGHKVRLGTVLHFTPALSARVVERRGHGSRVLEFEGVDDVFAALEEIGHVPLPPYMKRPDTPEDRERYQTVFARERGSVAAPTAGLHFTPEMLDRCAKQGGKIAHITLHVGLGTFAPLHVKDVEDVLLHEERYSVTPEALAVIRRARRRIAVGTTTVRTLETVYRSGLTSGATSLFISPGFHFQAVNAMLTNFHLPQSSLLILVSAFAGTELILAAYRHAVEQRYRFFSYGDCMLIL